MKHCSVQFSSVQSLSRVQAEEGATERVKFASRSEIDERINHIDIWKSRILYRRGELRYSQGTGEAAGSEVPSAGVQHARRLCARDEHGQDQPGGGHFPR